MLSCGDEVSTRISSCALPGASDDWLIDVRSAMDMSDFDVRVAVRLRLGLPLSDRSLPPVLSVMRICAITQVTPLGVSSCDAEASSSGMTAVRTALLGLPARTSASCMSITPKSEDSDSSKVPDLDIVFAAKSVLVDVSGTDPLIPSLRHDVAGIPGHALAVRGRRQAHQIWSDG
jgi:hypothetical protein